MRRFPLTFLFFTALVFSQSQPNCSQSLSFTTSAAGAAIDTTAGSNAGCAGWRLTWSVSGFTAATVQLEGSQDNSTWAAFSGATIVIEGTNPTSWTSATTSNSIVVRASLPYVRVNITGVTGSGTIKTLLLGYKGTSAQWDVSGGSGSSAFNAITSGTNTTATMEVGTGASLAPTGSGTITANQVIGAAATPAFSALASGSNTTATMTVGTGASLGPTGSGTLNANQVNGAAPPTSAGCTGTNASGQLIPASCGSPGSTYFSSTTQAGPSNTVTETSLIGTVTGSTTIAANTFTNGMLLKIEANGFFSLPAVADSLTIRYKCGSTVLGTVSFTPSAGVATNNVWRGNVTLTALGTGASGGLIANSIFETAGTGPLGQQDGKLLNTSVVAFDFTTACVMDVTAQWGGAQSGESITSTTLTAYIPGGSTSSTGLLPWQPATPQTPLALASWTQVNGGGNGTFADVRNGVLINSVSGDNLKALWLAAPSPSGTHFTITAHLQSVCPATSTAAPRWGIMVGDTGTKMVAAGMNNTSTTGGNLSWGNWSDETTRSASFSYGLAGFVPDPWFRVVYDGTNISFHLASGNGSDATAFFQYGSEGALSFLATAPAKIGFFAGSHTSGAPCIVECDYWSVTTP